MTYFDGRRVVVRCKTHTKKTRVSYPGLQQFTFSLTRSLTYFSTYLFVYLLTCLHQDRHDIKEGREFVYV